MSKDGPVTVRDAERLLRELETGDIGPDEAYRRMTRSEADTLTLLNRVVNARRADGQPPLHRLSVVEIVLKTMAAWRSIVVDISNPKNHSVAGLERALWAQDRKIYVGILCVLASAVAYFADAAS